MNFMSIILIIFSTFFATAEATTTISTSVPPNALKILTYEKNINSENIMVVHTTADSNCLPVPDSDSQTPILDYYWLMNRKTYKPLNPIIKSYTRERISATPSSEAKNIFFINLNDLSEVDIDLPSHQVSVETFRNGEGNCEAVGKMTLGESDANSTIILQKIFVDAQLTLNPRRPKVRSITLEGLDASTGTPKIRTYKANK